MLEQSIDMLPRLFEGLWRSIILLVVAAIVGLAIAWPMALMRLSGGRIAYWASYSYVFIFRGTPALVQLYFVYYGFSMSAALRESWAWYFFQNPWFCGLLALGLNTGAYQTEILRGALQAVPREHIDAGRALGLSERMIFWLVRMPEAFRLGLPAYGNELILLAKATSIVSTITILDLLGMAKLIYTETFDPFTPLLTAAALYLVLVWLMARAVSSVEWWLMPHMRGQLRGLRKARAAKAAEAAH